MMSVVTNSMSSSNINSTTSSSALGVGLTTMKNNVNVINVTMEKPTHVVQPNNLAETQSSTNLNQQMNPPMNHGTVVNTPTGRVSYVRRGEFYGALFDANHLATFPAGPKIGMLRPEDGIRKLRQMEKSQGIWSMEVQIMIDSKYLVIFDKKTGRDVEVFPIELVNDPTSVVSDDQKDAAYNNIILFTVLEDTRRKSSPPTEMHLFQCAVDVNSADIVDEIFKIKETKNNQMSSSHSHLQTYTVTHVESARTQFRAPGSYYPPSSNSNPSDNGFRPLVIPTHQPDQNNNSQMAPASVLRNRAAVLNSMKTASVDFAVPTSVIHPPTHHHSQSNQLSGNRVDQQVQVLNHCFDDIERFVSRLLASVETIRELEKRQQKYRHKSTKSKKHKIMVDEMQAVRAQLPQAQSFVDIFQKFKLSFNLLARLKSHIHNPNAPELAHFLFEPLELINNAINKEVSWLLETAAGIEAPAEANGAMTSNTLKGLPKSVWLPMLNKDAKELLLNCLNSKEQELWFALGDAWMVSREDAKLQPHLYADNIDLSQHYTPIFYDGWTPNLASLLGTEPFSVSYPSSIPSSSSAQVTTSNDFSRLAFSAAQAQQNGLKHVVKSTVDSAPIPPAPPMPPTKRINFVDESTLSNNTSRPGARSGRVVNQNESNASTALNYSKQPINTANIRNYEEMKKWAIDLVYRGAKVYEVVHDRQANNEKELTIKAGELLEVLDDKRNWWKLRNFYGNIGHAPVTILRPFDVSSVAV